jgi:hypothetical protein
MISRLFTAVVERQDPAIAALKAQLATMQAGRHTAYQVGVPIIAGADKLCKRQDPDDDGN